MEEIISKLKKVKHLKDKDYNRILLEEMNKLPYISKREHDERSSIKHICICPIYSGYQMPEGVWCECLGPDPRVEENKYIRRQCDKCDRSFFVTSKIKSGKAICNICRK